MNSEKINLRTLHLGDNQFSSVGIKLISDFLESDTSLAKLYLNDNSIDVEAASDLSDALCVNTGLQSLSLGNCSLSDEGFKHILSSLSVNRSLESLHIWKNGITDLTAEMLLEVVEKYNSTLQEMLIFGNEISNFDDFQTVILT